MIAQNFYFCDYYRNLFVETFPEALQGVSLDKLYAAINRCDPSFIRVEADEVTYSTAHNTSLRDRKGVCLTKVLV